MQQFEEIWQELKRFNVVQNGAESLACLAKEIPPLLDLVKKRLKAEPPYVTASVLMRHAAFVFTAHLFILSKFRLDWTGDILQTRLVDRISSGNWAPQWALAEGNWIPVQKEEDVLASIQRIICHAGRTLIQAVSHETNCPPLLLWENIWGYVLWMYVQLLGQPGDVSGRARNDLECLLAPETWNGVERNSPFRRFLNGQTPEDSLANYKRLTCCFYYQIPGNDRCSYCPNQEKGRKKCQDAGALLQGREAELERRH